jgi:hypothetical protein
MALAQALPPDLLRLVWGCEEPEDDGRPCGACLTCLQYDRAGLYPVAYGFERPPTMSELQDRAAHDNATRDLLLKGPLL